MNNLNSIAKSSSTQSISCKKFCRCTKQFLRVIWISIARQKNIIWEFKHAWNWFQRSKITFCLSYYFTCLHPIFSRVIKTKLWKVSGKLSEIIHKAKNFKGISQFGLPADAYILLCDYHSNSLKSPRSYIFLWFSDTHFQRNLIRCHLQAFGLEQVPVDQLEHTYFKSCCCQQWGWKSLAGAVKTAPRQPAQWQEDLRAVRARAIAADKIHKNINGLSRARIYI